LCAMRWIALLVALTLALSAPPKELRVQGPRISQNQIVTSMEGRQVGTVGWLKAQPGAYNVIPGKVTLGLELRDLDETKIVTMFNRIRAEATVIGQLNDTRISFSDPILLHPALTDKAFQKLIDDTAKELGLTTKVLPNSAGHDAQEIARIGPVGMIFNSQHRRDQPFTEGVLTAGRHRKRRQRPSASAIEAG
jgi:metal-dependent amidase/aminoacylase/carboxypeptidase family protein